MQSDDAVINGNILGWYTIDEWWFQTLYIISVQRLLDRKKGTHKDFYYLDISNSRDEIGGWNDCVLRPFITSTGQIFGSGALLIVNYCLSSVNWFLCSSVGHIWIFMFFIFSWGLMLSVACCRCCLSNFLLLSWNELLIFLYVLRGNALCLCLILFCIFCLSWIYLCALVLCISVI